MAELDDENLKVIRLDNGEILFSKVLVTDKSKDNGYLELHWPMKVLMKFNDEEKSTYVSCNIRRSFLNTLLVSQDPGLRIRLGHVMRTLKNLKFV